MPDEVEAAFDAASNIVADAHQTAAAIVTDAREEAIENREDAAATAVATAEAAAALANVQAASVIAENEGGLEWLKHRIAELTERQQATEAAQAAMAVQVTTSLEDLKSSVQSLAETVTRPTPPPLTDENQTEHLTSADPTAPAEPSEELPAPPVAPARKRRLI